MSIALENNRIGQVTNSGFIMRSKMRPCNNLSSIINHKDDEFVRVDDDGGEIGNGSIVELCSSSSSIGNNSDNDNDDENEVQSKLDNNPLDSLEQALPFRRGISKFYNGKSKSFASLSDATCSSSIKDIAKPENAYSRKRKNLLAYNLLYDKGRTSLLKSHGIGGGITKRHIHTSRSTLSLALAMSSSDSSIDENISSPETYRPYESRTPSMSPPTSPLAPPPMSWRSFSVVDLQDCAVNSNFATPMMRKISKPDEVA